MEAITKDGYICNAYMAPTKLEKHNTQIAIYNTLKNITQILQQQTIVLQKLDTNIGLLTEHIRYLPDGVGFHEAQQEWFGHLEKKETSKQ